jgi:hypothetical protein
LRPAVQRLVVQLSTAEAGRLRRCSCRFYVKKLNVEGEVSWSGGAAEAVARRGE